MNFKKFLFLSSRTGSNSKIETGIDLMKPPQPKIIIGPELNSSDLFDSKILNLNEEPVFYTIAKLRCN